MGNDTDNDGWTYRGRGYLMVTGRNNYGKYGYVDVPEQIKAPEVAIRIAAQYFLDNQLLDKSDSLDVKAVTKAVNGGYNGLEDRNERLMKFLYMYENACIDSYY